MLAVIVVVGVHRQVTTETRGGCPQEPLRSMLSASLLNKLQELLVHTQVYVDDVVVLAVD